MPVPRPLPDAVEAGRFGIAEDGRLIRPAPEEVRAIVKAARADLWSAVESGKLHLPIDKTFPLSQAAQALDHMKANAHFGKIVLVV